MHPRPDEEKKVVDRLVRLMVEEGRRFRAESAWQEHRYPENELERRQVKMVLAELRVINNELYTERVTKR